MSEFDHDRLDVYRAAIDFVVAADKLAEDLPRGRSYLADQLQRAATSIPLNIAEGAGEFRAKDKARFYRMARRSATESAAVLDVCRRLDLMDQSIASGARELLVRIVSMLIRMVRSLGSPEEDGHAGTGRGTGTGTKAAGVTD